MSNHIIVVIAVLVVVLLPATTLATRYKVGDNYGWTIGYDYEAWADDKEFKVGDQLEFVYVKAAHNVYGVNRGAFDQCDLTTVDPPVYYSDSGDDVVSLTQPGTYYFMCGVPGHCSHYNQKVAIDVTDA